VPKLKLPPMSSSLVSKPELQLVDDEAERRDDAAPEPEGTSAETAQALEPAKPQFYAEPARIAPTPVSHQVSEPPAPRRAKKPRAPRALPMGLTAGEADPVAAALAEAGMNTPRAREAKITVSVRADQDLHDRVRHMAFRYNVSMGDMFIVAMRTFLKGQRGPSS
jgi:hypothetical protein